MIRHRRGVGPEAEANTMDKVSRDITRDIGKVIKFVQGEPDTKKRENLMSLYHSAKYFIDRYDGASEDDKDHRFASHAVTLWTMILNQDNGRKILVVPMGGVTIPDATYYGYWCTIRGITTAQLSAIELYIEKMRIKAEVPPVAIDSTFDSTIEGASNVIDSVDGNENDDEEFVDAIATEPSAMDTSGPDQVLVAERENLPNMGNVAIDFNKGNVTIEEMITFVAERTRQLLVEEKEKEDIEVKEVDTVNRDRADSNASTIEANRETIEEDSVLTTATEPPIAPFQALNAGIANDTDHSKLGPIDQTMNDSGLAPPTTDSQTLPAPNLTIDVLDSTSDGFNDSSSWFEHEAQVLIHKNQSTPAPGKITIDIKDAYYVTIGSTNVECKLDKVGHLIKFIANIVNGPRNSNWVYRKPNQGWNKLYRKCFEFSQRNFPNFDFHRLVSQSSENECFEIKPQSPILPLVSAPRRKTLGEIGRSNAIDMGTPAKSPNTRNLRLHGRKGSRGQTPSPQNTPTTIEPVELGLQVLRVQQRLDNIETKLAREHNKRVENILASMRE